MRTLINGNALNIIFIITFYCNNNEGYCSILLLTPHAGHNTPPVGPCRGFVSYYQGLYTTNEFIETNSQCVQALKFNIISLFLSILKLY
jgi:hypothetical protein